MHTLAKIPIAGLTVLLAVLTAFPSPVLAQNDGVPAITWTRTFHVATDFPGGTGEFTLGEFPAGAVVERVYWYVDTSVTELDSMALLTAGDTLLSSMTNGAAESPFMSGGPLSLFMVGGRKLVARLYPVGPERTGQFRIIIVYRRLY